MLSDFSRTALRVGTIFMMHLLEGTRPFCVECLKAMPVGSCGYKNVNYRFIFICKINTLKRPVLL